MLLLLATLALALAAPVQKVSDQAIVDYFREVGVTLPDPMTPLAVQCLVDHKETLYEYVADGASVEVGEDGVYRKLKVVHKKHIYNYLSPGANVEVYPEGVYRMWQTGNPLYMMENEDGTMTQMEATPEPLVLPIPPWLAEEEAAALF